MKKSLFGLIRRPMTVIMISILLIFLGIVFGIQLPQEFVPDLQIPKLIVSAPYPGASPTTVRDLVTLPLEDALSSVPGMSNMRSVSRSGLASIEIEFAWGTDMVLAGLKVREIIDASYQTLPNDSKKPQVLSLDPNQQPLVIVGLYPVHMPLSDLKRIAEREILSAFQQVEGVGSSIFVGGTEVEVAIDIDGNALSARGLTVPQLSQIITQANITYPVGVIKEGSKQYLLVSKGEAESIKELNELQIYSQENGQYFLLSDVANISLKDKEANSLFFANGREGIGMIIRRQSGSNPPEVAQRIIGEVERLEQVYGSEIEFEVLHDASSSIKESINGIFLSLSLGAISAFFILLIFLRNLRSAVVLISALPISIAVTMTLLALSNISLNIMSLGGLALGIGMLVDNSVVVLENIEQNLGKSIPGQNRLQTIAHAAADMASSTLGSTLTSIVIFLPILFIPGIIGALYRDLALTVSYALIASFIVSITLVPVLASFFKTGKKPDTNQRTRNKPRKEFGRFWYRPILKAILRNPVLLVLLVAIMIGLGIASFLAVPVSLAGDTPSEELIMDIQFPPGSHIEYLKRVSQDLSFQLGTYPWLASYYIRAGAEGNDNFYFTNPEEARYILHIHLFPKANLIHLNEDIISILQRDFQASGEQVEIRQPPDILSELLGLTSREPELLIRARNRNELLRNTSQITDILSEQEIYTVQRPQGILEEIQLVPKREELSSSGLDLSSISQLISSAVYGIEESRFEYKGEILALRFRLNEQYRSSLSDLKELSIPTGNGTDIQLDEVLNINRELVNASLLRINRQDALILRAEESSTSVKQTFSQIASQFDHSQFLEESAFSENTQSLIIILSISLFLLYLVLGAQFESFLEPLYLLLTIPLSLAGISGGLLLFGHSLSIQAGLGILVLFGLVVNNAIVLRDQIKKRSNRGSSNPAAVIGTSLSRLRPIIITSVTTLLALIPIALEIFGPNSQSGLSAVVIGGLFISTALTILVIPRISLKRSGKKI